MLTIEQFAEEVQKKHAEHYGVSQDKVGEGFSLEPDKEIKLSTDISQTDGFLNLVNTVTTSKESGGSLVIQNVNRITQTNDTANGQERRPVGITPPVPNEFKMEKAHSDWKVHDDILDYWAQLPNYLQMYRNTFLAAMAQDRAIIGFHGTHHAVTSDLSTNPLMQDVNIGWFELVRQRAPQQIVTEGANAGQIRIGSTGDFANLDMLIFDMVSSIPMWKRQGLVAVVGNGLLAASQAKLYEAQADLPSEKERIQNKLVIGTYGGLPTISAAFLPENGVMVTSLKMNGNTAANLSIYEQKNTWKRSSEYVPKLEHMIDWNKRKECYHVEDFDRIKLLLPAELVFVDSNKTITNDVEV